MGVGGWGRERESARAREDDGTGNERSVVDEIATPCARASGGFMSRSHAAGRRRCSEDGGDVLAVFLDGAL